MMLAAVARPTCSDMTFGVDAQDIMSDPQLCADGITYEKAAIAAWLDLHDESPSTGRPLAHRKLVPNHTLRMVIQEACAQNAKWCMQ